MDKPEKPTVSKDIQEFMDKQGLEWVLCGGISVGMYTQPFIWRPRPKNEMAYAKEFVKRNVKLADYAKRVYKVLDEWDSLGKDTEWRYYDLNEAIKELRKCYERRNN